MRQKIVTIFIVLFTLMSVRLFGQDTIIYDNPSKNVIIGDKVAILEDVNNKLSINEVIQSKYFTNKRQQVPNLQISNSAFWIKMIITNHTNRNYLALNLEYPTIDSVTFINLLPSGDYAKIVTGEFVPYYYREFKHQSYIFKLNILPSETRVFFIKVIASEQIQLPLTLGTTQSISDAIDINDLIFGLYAGIILVMLLYNLFIYFTVRDRTYLYYVFYILFVGLSQACLQGYAQRFFYPDSAFLANAMMIWVPAISGIFGISFINVFIVTYIFTSYK